MTGFRPQRDAGTGARRNIRDALPEDIGTGDWTGLLVPDGRRSPGPRERARRRRAVRPRLVRRCDARARRQRGGRMAGRRRRLETPDESVVCRIEPMPVRCSPAERPALNFLQLLQATATVTRRHVRAIDGASPQPQGCAILDTRKTIPGLRQAQKYAVRVGGGQNQRLALWHGILIKENHIAAAGGVTQVLAKSRALDAGVEIQIEVETLASAAPGAGCRCHQRVAGQLRCSNACARPWPERRPGAARGVGRRARSISCAPLPPPAWTASRSAA